VEKVGDLGGDDLIVNSIIWGAEKKERINRLLEENGCDYRIVGIDVDNSIPPKTSFSVEKESK